MRIFKFCIGTVPWCLALLSTLLITACGGSKDPILGMPAQSALTPSVSATAPLARSPVVTGVAINTRITATFNKAMNPSSLNTNSFGVQCPAGVAINSSVSYNQKVVGLTRNAYDRDIEANADYHSLTMKMASAPMTCAPMR
mgnify:CR=1 FL=1